MSIGEDILDVLEEIGTSFTIVRDAGDVAGGYIWTKANSQVTKPFIREFFLEGYIAYDTEVEVGEVLLVDTTGKYYIVMNKSPDLLENIVYRYNVVLYLCNVVADVLRVSSEELDDRYRDVLQWSYVARQVHCLITTPLYGHELSVENQIGALGLENHEMYMASSVDVQALDRIRINSQEYYQVKTVKPRRYEAVEVFELSVDVRGSVTTTTTTTTTTTA